MKSFKVTLKNGTVSELKISNVEYGAAIKVTVDQLKTEKEIIKEKEDTYVSFKLNEPYPFLQFKDNKLLQLNNQDVIDYIWDKISDKGYHSLYTYTSEYEANWED